VVKFSFHTRPRASSQDFCVVLRAISALSSDQQHLQLGKARAAMPALMPSSDQFAKRECAADSSKTSEARFEYAFVSARPALAERSTHPDHSSNVVSRRKPSLARERDTRPLLAQRSFYDPGATIGHIIPGPLRQRMNTSCRNRQWNGKFPSILQNCSTLKSARGCDQRCNTGLPYINRF